MMKGWEERSHTSIRGEIQIWSSLAPHLVFVESAQTLPDVTDCGLGQCWGKGQGDLGSVAHHMTSWKSLNHNVLPFQMAQVTTSKRCCDEVHAVTMQDYVTVAVLQDSPCSADLQCWPILPPPCTLPQGSLPAADSTACHGVKLVTIIPPGPLSSPKRWDLHRPKVLS